jgi:hypothetical protein
VRLSPHPARAGPEGLITRGSTLRSTENGSSAGPLTAAMAAASSLSIGSGVNVIVVFGVHLTTSAPFRARAPGPVSGQLFATTSWRGWSCSRGFLSPFGCRRWLLGHPVPAGELGVPYGRLTGHRPAQTGFPCFARTSCDRGGCPLYSGTVVLILTGVAHRPAPVASQRRVPTPRHSIPSMWGSASRSINQGFKRFHPSDLPLACGPRMETGWALGLEPRASHPALTGDAPRGGDRSSSTDLQHALRHFDPASNLACWLNACDLTSHATLQEYRMKARCR